MPNVQIRAVPDDVHRRLRSQAALAGQSLNEFLLARLTELAALPTVPELAERIPHAHRVRRPVECVGHPRGAESPLIVIDASALTDFLLGRPTALEAIRIEFEDHKHEPLHAPELIEPETLNALRGLSRGGKITAERASEAVLDLAGLRLMRYPHAPLRARVWDLRENLTAYDASYLALAEALDGSVLIAGDAGLLDCARRSLGEERVRPVK